MTQFHLAQINIVRAIAELDDPVMAPFEAEQDRINALADASPGFVWRLQDESGNATAINLYDDTRILVNMSVWETSEDLRDYVYRSSHLGVLRDRKRWFEPPDGPYLALWWIPAGHVPTPQEGKQRLDHLRQHGPTPEAFTFKHLFPAELTT